jgi:5-methylthioadenosine/S-adenosylhomocysteine deaminase
MIEPQTLIFPRWLAPMTDPAPGPEAGPGSGPATAAAPPLTGHALCLAGRHIRAILPAAVARARYPNAECVELPRHLLLPGLVNAHTHSPMVLLRGYADDLPLAAWLMERIWPAEQRLVSPAFVADGSRLAIAEMLKSGITCFHDMYFFPEETAAVAAAVGIRAVVGLPIIDLPTAWAADGAECLRLGQAVHDHFRGHPLVGTALAPHAPYTVNDELLQRIACLAEELDLPIHMHIHETAREVADAVAADGRRPLARLAALGLLSPRLLAVHMTQIDAEEPDLLAHHGVHVIHCPESNMKLASGICPVPRLLAAGVNCALGTDGAASNNDLDLLGEIRSAALLAKCASGDPTALPVAQALRMATLGGAMALGLEARIGTLEPGKEADCIAVDLSGVYAEPVFDPLSTLVYATGREQVTDVWVAGRRLLKGRQLTTLDEAEVLERAAQWRGRVLG